MGEDLRKHDVIIRSESGDFYKLSQNEIELVGRIRKRKVTKKVKAQVGGFLGGLTRLERLKHGPYFVLNCPMFKEPGHTQHLEDVRYPRKSPLPPFHRCYRDDLAAPREGPPPPHVRSSPGDQTAPSPSKYDFVIITVPKPADHGRKLEGGYVCKLDKDVLAQYVWNPQVSIEQKLRDRIEDACNSGLTLALVPDVFDQHYDPSVAVCFVINCGTFKLP